MINFKINPDLLFTPGDKPERFAKAVDVDASGIIIDLEDGVAQKDKDLARNNVINYLSSRENKKIITLIRINHLTTQAGLEDLLALSRSTIYFDALIHPKTESPEEINAISEILEKKHNALPIFALIETSQGLTDIDRIVENSTHLAGLMFGAADYAVDVNSAITLNALLLARMKIVQAAALKKLASYDSPYFDFHNDAGLVDETSHVKELGFTGKAAIHPKQIDLIKKTFKPTDEAYQEAQAMIDVYDKVHGEACQYKGKMIDVPVYAKAKQIVELYENLQHSATR